VIGNRVWNTWWEINDFEKLSHLKNSVNQRQKNLLPSCLPSVSRMAKEDYPVKNLCGEMRELAAGFDYVGISSLFYCRACPDLI
jgi:hypothetical protein